MNLRDLRLTTAHALVAQAAGSEAALPSDTPLHYLQGLIDGLCELSLKDPLTGLANRRHFRTVLEREIDRVTRAGEAALLLMLDIDNFKRVNDTYGHLAGDIVLQSVARTLNGCVRPMDTLARYGGEEFAVVLPACQAGFGRVVAERIRRAIEAHAGAHLALGRAQRHRQHRRRFCPAVDSQHDAAVERARRQPALQSQDGRPQPCQHRRTTGQHRECRREEPALRPAIHSVGMGRSATAHGFHRQRLLKAQR